MKKKIGIVTFKGNNNFGAFLQAFSLQYVLSKKNYNVEIIDYIRQTTIENSKLIKMWPKHNLLTMIKSIIMARNNFILRKKVQSVHDKLNLSEKQYFTSEELHVDEMKWDKVIVGSDQVWNYNNTKFDPVYFLDFIDDNDKKVSYAASFGVSEIPEMFPKEINNITSEDNFRVAYAKYLEKFSSISVREQTGKTIVEELTNQQAEIVLDPTLLLTKEEWRKLARGENQQEEYILIYSLDNKKELFEQAQKISKKLNLPIKQIFAKPKSKKYGIKNIYTDPFEWVGSFLNASYIITDSFHGAAFSINLEKPFRVFYHEGKNTYTRIDNLLEMFGLENQKMTADSIVTGKENIDYADVRQKLDAQREKSFEFIDKSLK